MQKNVTLGIPRLREIIMVASKEIATPTMTLTLQPHATRAHAEKLAREMSHLTLHEFIREATVTEKWVNVEVCTVIIRVD